MPGCDSIPPITTRGVLQMPPSPPRWRMPDVITAMHLPKGSRAISMMSASRCIILNGCIGV